MENLIKIKKEIILHFENTELCAERSPWCIDNPNPKEEYNDNVLFVHFKNLNQHHFFKEFINDEPIFIYQKVNSDRNWGIGNQLGLYFEAVSCARESGMHFIGLSFDSKPKTFLDYIESVIIHPSPVSSHTEGIQNMYIHCFMDEEEPWAGNYCWNKNHVLIKQLIGHGLHKLRKHNPELHSNATLSLSSFDTDHKNLLSFYLNYNSDNQTNIRLNNRHSSALQSSKFPLIPDILIHSRCSDTLAYDEGFPYGINKFKVYDHIFNLISYDKSNPMNLIYIIGDTVHQENNNFIACHLIRYKLKDYLTSSFPNSTILYHNSSSIEQSIHQLSKAPVVICSTSTFCFWPSFYNSGTIYFPLSNLMYIDHSVKHFLTKAEANLNKISSKVILVPSLLYNMTWIASPPILTFPTLDMKNNDDLSKMIQLLLK
eukprot:gene7311-9959_t